MIKQRGNSDCNIACIAMMVERDYNTVKNRFLELFPNKKEVGEMDSQENAKVLRTFGVQPMLCYTLVQNVPALVVVPSMYSPLKFHSIYWNGSKVFDPANGPKTYNNEIIINFWPIVETIICESKLKINLPKHFYNRFDWGFIDGVTKT